MKRLWATLVLLGVIALATQAQTAPTITAVYTDCTSIRVEINNTTSGTVLVELRATDAFSGVNVIGQGNTFSVGPLQRGGVSFSLSAPLTTAVNFETFIFDNAAKNVAYGRNSQDCTNEPQPLNNRDSGRPFRVFCDESGGVNFLLVNSEGNATSGVKATVGQLAGALISAANTGTNQPAASNINGLSVWALTSGEIQAVYRGGLGNYDFIFPISNCGGLDITGPINVMITSINSGVAPTSPTTTLPGTIPSFSPSVGAAPVTGAACAPIAPNTRAHTVQRGQTLFRIGQAYGVSFNTIATLNGIYNPNLIYAGQCLQIP